MNLFSHSGKSTLLVLAALLLIGGLMTVPGPIFRNASVRAAMRKQVGAFAEGRSGRNEQERSAEAQKREKRKTELRIGRPITPTIRAFEQIEPPTIEPATAAGRREQEADSGDVSPLSMLLHGVPERERYDKPAEAVSFYRKKRVPEGENEIPIERYFTARERMKTMPRYSTAERRYLRNQAGTNRAEQEMLANWTSLGPGNIGGRTRAMVIHPQEPNIIYAAGVSGGVWKSTDGGSTWAPISDLMANISVNSLAMDPKDSKVIYAGTGEGYFAGDSVQGAGIFRTTDGGTVWTRLDSTANKTDFFYVNDLVVSPNDSKRLYAATGNGVWRSIDGGETWSRVLPQTVLLGCLDLAIRTDQTTDYIFASCGSLTKATIYRNTDAAGTGTWNAVHTETDMGRTSLAIAPSNQNVVYAMTSAYLFGSYQYALHAVFRSMSGGDPGSWTAQVRNSDANKLNTALLSSPRFALATDCGFALDDDFIGQGWYDNVIAVDPVDPNRVWVGGIDLFRSDDGGVNWGIASNAYVEDIFSIHPDQHVILFHPQYNGTSNQVMYVANDGGIFRTDNARAGVLTGPKAACGTSGIGVKWTTLNNNYGVTQFYHGLPFPSGSSYFGGTQDNGTLLGSDAKGSNAWREINPGDGGYVAVDSANPSILYAEYTGISIRKSTDGGNTFGNSTFGIDDSGLFISPYVMDPSDPSRLWTGGAYLWRTTNGAAQWSVASDLTAGSGAVSSIAIAPTNAASALAGMEDGYILRTDSALLSGITTFWAASRPRSGYVSWVAFDPTNKDIAYATYSTFGGSHVWRSIDGGVNWTPIDGSGTGTLPDIPVHSIVVEPGNTAHLYIGTDMGVFVSADGGATWAIENTGFANVVTESLALNVVGGVTQLFAFTHGRGAWRVNLNNTGCLQSIAPATRSLNAGAATGSINVTADPNGCAWSSTSNVPWISVAGSGAGNGVASYSVLANNTLEKRAGTATIAGKSFTVFQDGLPDDLAPVVLITKPAGSGVFSDTTGAIDVSGTVTDNGTVTLVTWATDRGASGVAIGTNSWSITQLPLSVGLNTITITAQDAAGNIGRRSIVVRSTPAAVVTTIAGTGVRAFSGDGGDATAARINRPVRLAYDTLGNLFFTDSENHRVRKVAPDGTISTVAGTGVADYNGDNIPAIGAQLNFPIGIALDKTNNIFIVDNNNNRIRRVAADTGMITTVAGNGTTGYGGDDGPAINAVLNEPQSVAVDAAGNLYISDLGNNRIRKVTKSTGMIATVAGNGTAGFSGDNGLATAAQLNGPNDVSLDSDANLYICDAVNNRIRKVSAVTNMISTIVGNGRPGFAGDTGPAVDAQINSPVGAIIDAAGNLFFSDRGNQRIRRVDAATKLITTIAGTGTPGFNGDGLAALRTFLNGPSGLAFDTAGNLVFADRDNSRLRRLMSLSGQDVVAPVIAITSPTTSSSFTTTSSPIELRGTATDNSSVLQVRWTNDRGGSGQATGIATWTAGGIPLLAGINRITVSAYDPSGNVGQATLIVAFEPASVIITAVGKGTSGSSDSGVAPATALLRLPSDVDVGPDGSIYIADSGNQRVWKVTTDGVVTSFAGNGMLGSSGDGGPGANATLNMPCAVAADSNGNVYISDTLNQRVRRVAADGTITTVAGTGEEGYAGDDGPAVAAHLNSPVGVAVDTAGNVYIADANNNRIRKVRVSDGKITTIAGNGQVGFGGDGGPATSALLNFPTGVAVDEIGNVYIADIENVRIRRVSTDGNISTIAGNGTAGFAGDDGPATAARLNQPYLLRVDKARNLYIADSANQRVRRVALNTGIISTIAGNGTLGSAGDGGAPQNAQLNLPSGVGIDQVGSIYIADYGNNRIRRILPLSAVRVVVSVSAASFSGSSGLAPEAIAATFGTDQATAVHVASTTPLPLSLGGTTVLVKDSLGVGRLAQLFFVSAGQVNFLVPAGTANGTATITVTNAQGKVSIGTAAVSSVAPGVFSANSDGQGVAAALTLRIRGDGSQVLEQVAGFNAAEGKFVALPIDLGPPTDQVFLLIFGTGLRFNSALTNVSASVDGVLEEVLYAGAQGAFAGLDQVNVRLSRNLTGRGLVDVLLTVDGKTANTVKIHLK